MRFELTAVDRGGALVRYVLEAESMEAARALARADRHEVIGLRALGRGAAGGIRKRQDLLTFCEALEQVLSGGLTLGDGLRALAADEGSAAARIAASVSRQIAFGLAPSRAFEASGQPWPALLPALLRSGERSGRLDAALASFIAVERRWLEMRARLVSASVYPMVLLVISLLVLLFLMGFVVPKFASAFDDLQNGMPTASRWIIGFGTWLGDHLAQVLAGLGLAVVAAVTALRHPALKARLSAPLLGLPGVARIVHLADRSQALRIVSALLAGGTPLPDALETARGTAGPLVGRQIAQARARIGGGQRPSQAFGASGGIARDSGAEPALLDPVAVQLVAAAERRGGLAECFERLAQRDEQQLARVMDRAAAVYGPVLLLVIAVIVGGVVVALYWPMLQVFDQIG